MVMTMLVGAAGAGDHDECNPKVEDCEPLPPENDDDDDDDEATDDDDDDDDDDPAATTNRPPLIDGCEAIDPFDLDLLSSITAVGSEVGVVLATDPDGDSLTFSGADADGLFSVSETGTLSVTSALPAPSSADYVVSVFVTVSDGELSAIGTCEITVDPLETSGHEATRIYASSSVGSEVPVALLGEGSWVPTVTSEFFAFDAATNVISVALAFPRPATGSTDDARIVQYELEFGGGTVSEIVTASVTIVVVDFFDDDNPDVYGDAAIYEDAINWMADPAIEGRISPVTSGCGVLVYCPEDPTTRGHIAVFVTRLWQLVDESVDPADVSNPFADTEGHRFQLWITALFEAGITNGCGFDTNGDLIYCPQDSLEWGEFAIMVNRAIVGFTDSGEVAAASQGEALEWLTSSGFTEGVLTEDLCETGACQNDLIERGPTALVLRNIWDKTALGD